MAGDSPPSESAGPPAVDSSVPADSAPLTVDTLPPLTPDGWGPLQVGMTLAEIVAAAGDDANPGAVGGPDPDSCDEFRPERAPAGLLVMVEQGRLTRISLLAGSPVRTERGFMVGDSASAVEAAYGAEAVTSPHKYVPAPARYVTVWRTEPPSSGARGLVYEVGADGLVSHIHAGGPSIQYVEGCL